MDVNQEETEVVEWNADPSQLPIDDHRSLDDNEDRRREQVGQETPAEDRELVEL